MRWEHFTDLKKKAFLTEKSVGLLRGQKLNFGEIRNTFQPVIEALGIVCVLAYIFYNNLLWAVFLLPVGYLYYRRRKKDFELVAKQNASEDFKDAMQAVVAALSAGYSIENAFREATKEMEQQGKNKGIIYDGFVEIVYRLNINVNLEDAFWEFAGHCDIEDIRNFGEILLYSKRLGGNLINIIKNTTSTISEKIDVKKEIVTIIRAKQFEQNIMNLVPLGIIFYMRITSSDMFGKLYGNTVGICIMTACLAVYLAAYFIATKIVDIRV